MSARLWEKRVAARPWPWCLASHSHPSAFSSPVAFVYFIFHGHDQTGFSASSSPSDREGTVWWCRSSVPGTSLGPLSRIPISRNRHVSLHSFPNTLRNLTVPASSSRSDVRHSSPLGKMEGMHLLFPPVKVPRNCRVILIKGQEAIGAQSLSHSVRHIPVLTPAIHVFLAF